LVELLLLPGGPIPNSIRGNDCGGALTRLEAKEGMEVDIRLAKGEGAAIGVAFGERALIVVATSLPLVVKDALDDVRGFPVGIGFPVVEERVVERVKRVEASEGARCITVGSRQG
jgi:hypothetical protein